MDLITGALLIGLGYLGVKAIGGKSGGSSSTTTTTSGSCDDPKDCAKLIACAGPLLAKATAADTIMLNSMLVKATALGCTGLAKQITDLLASFGTVPDSGGGGYSVLQNVGSVMSTSAAVGDMLIIAISDSTGSKRYIIPVVYDKEASDSLNGFAVFEKKLASLAIDKFKKTSPVDPSTVIPGVFVGAPGDLPNGTSFKVRFAVMPLSGSVIGVVTDAEMKSASFTPAPTSSTAFDVTGEGLPLAFGGSGKGSVMGGNFGSKSRFGAARVGS